ncbi:sodium-translocating pyrophosphatase [Peloplasma aerotolerans]|jgi:K(+)-stimulated pyrophosphate-energized sodium pump|uniref:Putative K(+)-stimulated pyrophosphate-energized sodium pump n=1 Tax=Peloplasma aerotolerans TaxID=3044389 RepID=A0AAW6U9W5_9MOLU|nr:sodium-translocating pyrophosphatase [Mariniplasma sp. M4Ah]MDI6452749.1 sodium-translocating pyrophosphatase [Mariniplasma sp. M4Ah]
MSFDYFPTTTIFIGVAAFSALIACLYAFVLYKKVTKIKVNHQRIEEISSYIHEGAMAFMKRQYTIIIYFALGVGSLLALTELIPSLQGAEGVGWKAAIAFIFGALFSGLAGWIGMHAATKANSRTTSAANTGGMPSALRVAFSGGSVLGLTVVGLGLFGLTALFFIFYWVYGGNTGVPREQYLALTHAINTVTGYGLGASLIALFGRVGGGIFTKAADVGADLVGKVEAGIPEDDPRNPAVIADNVGDNVGDVAGMGSDLTESYIGSIISALTLGLYAFVTFTPQQVMDGIVTIDSSVLSGIFASVLYPLLIAGFGAISAVVAVWMIRRKDWHRPQFALSMSTYLAALVMLVTSLVLSHVLFDGVRAWGVFGAVTTGLFVGIGIGFIAEYYTSSDYKHVKEIANQSLTGHATNVIAGYSVGMLSTFLTVVVLVAGIVISYLFTGDMYGIALAAVGMLSTAGITISVDAYGPIADNAGGIAQMSKLDEGVRKITDKLDSVGNTTAAIGKGFCIGSAALTSIGLFFAFEKSAGLSDGRGIDILQPGVMVGVFIGAMLPFLFTSLVIKSVGRAANKMIDEVRRQFKEDPGIMEGTSLPDYARCVDISTKAALKEMILPAMIAVFSPIIAGVFLGAEGLGGLLVGGLVSAIMLAVFMANSGGAWDNAKKFIEEGNLGGKGSDAHKAAVTGDTVGDPFKDTAGPSMDILIKLMSIVSLIIVPILAQIEPILSFLFN